MYHRGTNVRIIDRQSPFYLKTGVITGISQVYNGEGSLWVTIYSVKLNHSTLTIQVYEDKLISSRGDEERFVNNIYHRYMWIRLEALSEVLELLRSCDSIDEAYDAIINYLHTNSRRCMDSNIGILSLLPEKDKIRLNDLVKFKNQKKEQTTGL